MPELPEVETVRLTLAPALGARIAGVWTSGKKLRLGAAVPKRALAALVGGRLGAVRRHGKYLLLDVEGGAGQGGSILVHLGMSGQLRLQRAAAPRPPHTHVVWQLEGDGELGDSRGVEGDRSDSPAGRVRGAPWAMELRFVDPRRFGQVDVVATADTFAHPSLTGLGPDPVADPASWSGGELYASARGKKTTLKALILDQTIVAGVGNIYASEALWRARLRPTARAHTLSRAAADLLAQAVKDVFAHALDHGGTSLRDYVNADGASGDHAHYLHVYGRDGQACVSCGSTIRRTVLQGRATFHCPTCQKR